MTSVSDQMIQFYSLRAFNQLVNISLRDKFVWLKNAKVASSTLSQTLQQSQTRDFDKMRTPPHPGITSSAMVKAFQLPQDILEETLTSSDYVRFAFVRNPYARLVSAYIDKVLRNVKEKSNILKFMGQPEAPLESEVSFAEFIDAVCSAPAHQLDKHWMPQVYSTASHFLDLAFIGKIETFDHDFQALSDMIGIDFSHYYKFHAPHRTNAAETWQSMYSDPSIKAKVDRYFGEDFERFGYSQQLR